MIDEVRVQGVGDQPRRPRAPSRSSRTSRGCASAGRRAGSPRRPGASRPGRACRSSAARCRERARAGSGCRTSSPRSLDLLARQLGLGRCRRCCSSGVMLLPPRGRGAEPRWLISTGAPRDQGRRLYAPIRRPALIKVRQRNGAIVRLGAARSSAARLGHQRKRGDQEAGATERLCPRSRGGR